MSVAGFFFIVGCLAGFWFGGRAFVHLYQLLQARGQAPTEGYVDELIARIRLKRNTFVIDVIGFCVAFAVMAVASYLR
jgi:hypothetical protein